jgi:hypothetical protein
MHDRSLRLSRIAAEPGTGQAKAAMLVSPGTKMLLATRQLFCMFGYESTGISAGCVIHGDCRSGDSDNGSVMMRLMGNLLVLSFALVVFGGSSAQEKNARATSPGAVDQAPLQAGENLPKLGTWEFEIKPASGKAVKQKVTFVRKDGSRIYGIREWFRFQVFSVTVDPKRVVRLETREHHANGPNMGTINCQGTLSADGRELSNLRFEGVGSTGATGTAKWLNETVPAYPKLVNAALNLSDERHLLYQQCSGNFVLDGVWVLHGPDRPLLTLLSRSKNKHVQELAEVRVACQQLYDQAAAVGAKDQKELAQADLARRARIFQFMGEVVGADTPDDSRKAVAGLLNSVGLKEAFDSQRAAVEVASVQVAAMNYTRAKVRADYETRNKGKALDPSKVTAGFDVNKRTGRGVVTFRNDTDRDLHNVLVSTQMTVDQSKVAQYQRDSTAKESAAGVLAVMLGIDSKIVGSGLKTNDVLFNYHRLEKGVLAFIPLWPKRAALEVEVAMPGHVQFLAASLGAWVGSDEGSAAISLDLKEARKRIPKKR